MALQNYYSALYSKLPYMIKNSHINLKLNNTTIMTYTYFTKYCISYSYTPYLLVQMWNKYQVKYK